jgi:hypothetical protein
MDIAIHLPDQLADLDASRSVGPGVGEAPHRLPLPAIGLSQLRCCDDLRRVLLREVGADADNGAAAVM